MYWQNVLMVGKSPSPIEDSWGKSALSVLLRAVDWNASNCSSQEGL